MKQNPSDFILLSDIDGTLLEAPAPIPPRNLQALERYTKAGGHFGLATGRSIESTREFVAQLPITAPCIIYNGAGIYDYREEKLLYAKYLPETYHEYVKAITRHFPQIGAAMLDRHVMHSVARRYYTDLFLGIEQMRIVDSDLDTLDVDCFKAIFSIPEEEMQEVIDFIAKQNWPDVEFVRSNSMFYEMLPAGVSKGSGLRNLIALKGLERGHVVAIGDYYNDETILKAAGISATVAKAPEDIKRICTLVVGECEQGAVADLIEYIEQLCV